MPDQQAEKRTRALLPSGPRPGSEEAMAAAARAALDAAAALARAGDRQRARELCAAVLFEAQPMIAARADLLRATLYALLTAHGFKLLSRVAVGDDRTRRSCGITADVRRADRSAIEPGGAGAHDLHPGPALARKVVAGRHASATLERCAHHATAWPSGFDRCRAGFAPSGAGLIIDRPARPRSATGMRRLNQDLIIGQSGSDGGHGEGFRRAAPSDGHGPRRYPPKSALWPLAALGLCRDDKLASPPLVTVITRRSCRPVRVIALIWYH